MVNTQVIYDNYFALTQALNQLIRQLKTLHYVHALATPVPPTTRGQEHQPIHAIELDYLQDNLAIDAICTSYTDLHIHPDYSQKSARRTPGVIVLSPAVIGEATTQEIVTLIDRINHHKQQIESFITEHFQTRQARFEVRKKHLPGMMTLHLYRQIRYFYQEELVSVAFSWQRKDTLIKVNKEALIASIEQEYAQVASDQQLALEQLLAKIVHCDEAALRIRRAIKVQPIANITKIAGIEVVTAPLPIIVLQDDPVKVRPLLSFDSSVKRKTRSDKVPSEILGTFNGETIERFLR